MPLRFFCFWYKVGFGFWHLFFECNLCPILSTNFSVLELAVSGISVSFPFLDKYNRDFLIEKNESKELSLALFNTLQSREKERKNPHQSRPCFWCNHTNHSNSNTLKQFFIFNIADDNVRSYTIIFFSFFSIWLN